MSSSVKTINTSGSFFPLNSLLNYKKCNVKKNRTIYIFVQLDTVSAPLGPAIK